MAALIGTTAALGTTQGNPPPSTYTIKFGQDRAFSTDELNDGGTQGDCGAPGASCTSLAQPNGLAASSAFVQNTLQDLDAEAFVGVRYVLERACVGQNVTLPFYAEYTLTYSLQTDQSLGSSTRASINLRAQSPSETVTPTVLAADGLDAVQTSPVTYALELTPDLNMTYRTTLGARSEARVTVDVPEANDFSDADATANLVGLRLEFNDDTAPRSNHTLTPSAGAPGTVSTGFVGWYKHPVTLGISAYDPIVNANVTIPHSCVKEVRVQDGDADLQTLPVNFNQESVSLVLDENRRYDLRIYAVDHQGNVQPSPTTNALGFDNQPPLTAVTVSPPTPNGNNSWYKRVTGTQVQYVVTCDDSNQLGAGEYSGCKQANWTFSTGGSGSQSITTELRLNALEGTGVSLSANALDKANNGDVTRSSLVISVDLTAPRTKRTVTPLSEYSNDWWRGSVYAVFECDRLLETGSGCAHNRTRINGTGSWTNITHYNFTEQANYTVNTESEDVAGNVGGSGFAVRLDLTAPGSTPGLVLDPPGVVDGGTMYVNRTPRWVWNAASDVPSGVRHYRVLLDNVFQANVTSREFTAPSSIADGNRCLKVAAVDQAGNVGADTTSCVFVDRVRPVNNFVSPLAGHLLTYDGRTIPLSSTDRTFIIGHVWANVSATDASPSSRLKTTKIYDNLTTQRIALPCDVQNASFCSYHEAPTLGLAAGFSERRLEGDSLDKATNLARAYRNYTRVDLGILRLLTGSGAGTASDGATTTQGELHWKGYSGTDFVRYEIHRSLNDDFLPSSSTLVASITEQSTVSTLDSPPTTGVYHYKLLTYSGLGLVPGVSHEVVIDYAAQTIGEPVSCTNQINSCK